jgi:hypothetical protein
MKILIIDSTQVNYGDDRGGVHEETGSFCDVPKDQAKTLTEANRALYVNKSDDPHKDGRFTASAEMVKAAEKLAKATKAKAPVIAPEPKEPTDPPAA